jgi:hypothetical protein
VHINVVEVARDQKARGEEIERRKSSKTTLKHYAEANDIKHALPITTSPVRQRDRAGIVE